MCNVLLPPGVNPIAVNKFINKDSSVLEEPLPAEHENISML
jgi:hypothetical protein